MQALVKQSLLQKNIKTISDVLRYGVMIKDTSSVEETTNKITYTRYRTMIYLGKEIKLTQRGGEFIDISFKDLK